MSKYKVTYDGTSLEFTGVNTGVHLSVEEYLRRLEQRVKVCGNRARLFIEDEYKLVRPEPQVEAPEALRREEES